MELTKPEARALLQGFIPDSLIERLQPGEDVYCRVCGDDDCSSEMAHIEDEELMHEVMGFGISHPDGFCPKCGSSQTIYEADTDGYECEEPDCLGLLLHPQRVLGIV